MKGSSQEEKDTREEEYVLKRRSRMTRDEEK
jgi:hypothetical protein